MSSWGPCLFILLVVGFSVFLVTSTRHSGGRSSGTVLEGWVRGTDAAGKLCWSCIVWECNGAPPALHRMEGKWGLIRISFLHCQQIFSFWIVSW